MKVAEKGASNGATTTNGTKTETNGAPAPTAPESGTQRIYERDADDILSLLRDVRRDVDALAQDYPPPAEYGCAVWGIAQVVALIEMAPTTEPKAEPEVLDRVSAEDIRASAEEARKDLLEARRRVDAIYQLIASPSTGTAMEDYAIVCAALGTCLTEIDNIAFQVRETGAES